MEIQLSKIGNFLKDEIWRRRTSGPKLSEQTGININTIWSICRGRGNPNLTTFVQLFSRMGYKIILQGPDSSFEIVSDEAA